jgi:hypothetical protein
MMLVILLTAHTCLVAGRSYGETDKPIIAHLLASPSAYKGRIITIYGLVIETEQAGRVFMLQDVSQIPLKIVRADGKGTALYDQVLVNGVFEIGPHGPRFNALKVEKAKVLAGGGCC